MENKKCCGISPGLIISSSFIGYLIYIAFLIGMNVLFLLKLIPVQMMSITSKALLFVFSLILGLNIKKQVREEVFANCIITVMLFCVFALLTSILCSGGKINIAGVVICVLICFTGCLLLFIKNDKYGKMHKKRHKR